MPDERVLPPGAAVLVLDDDAPLRRRISAFLRAQGLDVTEATSLSEARRLAAELVFDFALLDLHLPDGEALSLLRDQVFPPTTTAIVMTAFGSIEKAVAALRLGASDYLAKPFELPELPLAFQRSRAERNSRRREEHRTSETARRTGEFHFGASLAPLRRQLETLRAAETRLQSHLPPVLLEGETGTGKSALARWIHESGPRQTRPFLAVNCAALPDALVEAELFGHERGAFTDAKQARVGLFEAADGGTLFLDEVGSLNPATQAKLLVALEEGRIRRVGATRETQVDVRIIAAANQPLTELVRAGRFRDDLRHRLHLVAVQLPPLRERGADIVALAEHLLAQLARRHRRPHLRLTPAATTRLCAQAWPGNVRELAHELERAAIFSPHDDLELAHLAVPAGAPLASAWRNPNWRMPDHGFALDDVVAELIDEALRETHHNVSAAARRLGVTRDFLRYRLEAKAEALGSPGPNAAP